MGTKGGFFLSVHKLGQLKLAAGELPLDVGRKRQREPIGDPRNIRVIRTQKI